MYSLRLWNCRPIIYKDDIQGQQKEASYERPTLPDNTLIKIREVKATCVMWWRLTWCRGTKHYSLYSFIMWQMFKSPVHINEFTGGIKHDQLKISPSAKSWWIQSIYSRARQSNMPCEQLRYFCIGTMLWCFYPFNPLKNQHFWVLGTILAQFCFMVDEQATSYAALT